MMLMSIATTAVGVDEGVVDGSIDLYLVFN